MRSICSIAGIIFCLVVSFACSTALAAEPKRVLMLHSFGPDVKPWSEYARAIRAELAEQSPWPLNLYEHSLVTARFSDEDPEVPFVEYLRALFAKQPLDLIVSIGAPAAAFVQRHRQQLFSTTPMVFTAVDQRRVRYSVLTANDAVVAVSINYLGALENILRVLPDTKHVALVVGNSPIEKFWLEEIRNEWKPFANRLAFTWYNDLSFEDILKHAAALPPHSAIFWELMVVDAAGVVHEGSRAIARLHAVANAPIFSYDDSFFGSEIVGGPLVQVPETSRKTAEVAVRILGGEKAGDIKVAPIGFGTPKFDWREMQRWGISESRLPPESDIQFRIPTVWDQYRGYILAIIAAILIQAALISWLIYEHWRRHVAEADSFKLTNELARMNRFATAGELSASLAHEIRQPLAAIQTFGNAGLNWLKKQLPDLDEVRNTLQNVVKESHRAENIIKSIRAMFKNESVRTQINLNELTRQVMTITARSINSNNIVLNANFTNDRPPLVMADPVQLQQVILNLVMNAVEAMNQPGHRTRILRLGTQMRPDGTVLMKVTDSGPSVDPKVAEKMFQPFFTTKPGGMGMGLSICKTIVEAHGGTLTASPSKPHGMEIQIVLPRYQLG